MTSGISLGILQLVEQARKRQLQLEVLPGGLSQKLESKDDSPFENRFFTLTHLLTLSSQAQTASHMGEMIDLAIEKVAKDPSRQVMIKNHIEALIALTEVPVEPIKPTADKPYLTVVEFHPEIKS